MHGIVASDDSVIICWDRINTDRRQSFRSYLLVSSPNANLSQNPLWQTCYLAPL